VKKGQRGPRHVRVWWKATRQKGGIGGFGRLAIRGTDETNKAPHRLLQLLASCLLRSGQVDHRSRVESETSAGGQ
jgi:hypothetical protein